MSSKMWKNSVQNSQNSNKDDIGNANRILDGVSSLHSWIKKTNVLPTAKMSHIRSQYDEVKQKRDSPIQCVSKLYATYNVNITICGGILTHNY